MSKEAAKILLVEDEPTIRYVVERQFRALGYKLTDIACDGSEAVDKASKSEFDIILMDVRMPRLDGIAATKALRDAGVNSVIVGMTAFFHKNECLSAGMDDFIQKPVMLEQLKDLLERWATERPQRVANRQNLSIPGPEKFEQTREHLEDLQRKILELRRRSGLQPE